MKGSWKINLHWNKIYNKSKPQMHLSMQFRKLPQEECKNLTQLKFEKTLILYPNWRKLQTYSKSSIYSEPRKVINFSSILWKVPRKISEKSEKWKKNITKTKTRKFFTTLRAQLKKLVKNIFLQNIKLLQRALNSPSTGKKKSDRKLNILILLLKIRLFWD